jgi:fructose-1,6-bisphosphatase/inositol monophosphatase family enzyme
MKPIDIEKVAALIREAAEAEVLPRFRNLASHELQDKGTNDPVTAADLGVEKRLTAALPKLLPGSVVVGEEAAHHDQNILERLSGPDPVWVIDPIDGTQNFANGSDWFCIMVALASGGKTHAGWVYFPTKDEMVTAEQGSGAFSNGARLATPPAPALKDMKGSVHTKYLAPELKQSVEQGIGCFASNKQLYCAGLTYVWLARGELHHALFWRTKPWDHSMGALILREAGGRISYLDGEDYLLGDGSRKGIVAVGDPRRWTEVRDALFPDHG